MLSIGFVTPTAQVPIPMGGYDGFKRGNADAPIQFELFADLKCPDCKAVWPTVKAVADAYGPATMRLTLHAFPLPYHTWAFHLAQSAFVVHKSNSSALFDWVDVVFANQDNFDNSVDRTAAQVVSGLESLAVNAKLLPKGIMSTGMADSSQNELSRVSWKYGCSRGVTGTPSFLINGVAVAASLTWSVADWKTVLDPLVPASIRAPPKTSLKAGGLQDCKNGTKFCEYLPGKTECCTPGENCIPNVGCRC